VPGQDVSQLYTVARELPNPAMDSISATAGVPVRGGRYGEQYVLSLIPTKHVLADEGSYFVTSSADFYYPGYTLTFPVETQFDDTNPLLYVMNNDRYSGRRLYLDYIKFFLDPGDTFVPTPPWTGVRFAIILDPIQRTNRLIDYTQSPVPANYFWDGYNTPPAASVNSDFDIYGDFDMGQGNNSDMSVCTVYAQNNANPTIFTPSSPAARVVANCSLGGPGCSGDVCVLVSGSTDSGAYAGDIGPPNGTSPGHRVSIIPPIILGGGAAITVTMWMPGANTAIPYEFEMGWWER
jgi:hypothetical protein